MEVPTGMPERERLARELQEGTSKLEELRKDLEWRERDLEHEREKLKELGARDDEDALKLIGPQLVVVQTQERVLENERKEYDELKVRLEEIARILST